MFEIIMLLGFLYAATSQMRLRKDEDFRQNGKASHRSDQTCTKKDGQTRQIRIGQPRQKSRHEMMAA